MWVVGSVVHAGCEVTGTVDIDSTNRAPVPPYQPARRTLMVAYPEPASSLSKSCTESPAFTLTADAYPERVLSRGAGLESVQRDTPVCLFSTVMGLGVGFPDGGASAPSGNTGDTEAVAVSDPPYTG